MRSIPVLATLGALLLSTGSALAATILDQEQAASPVFTGAPSAIELVQSFTPTANNVAGVGFATFTFSGGAISGDVTVSLIDDLPGSGGSVLAAGTIAGVVDDGSFNDVFFPAVGVVPEQVYYLLFEVTNEVGGLLRLGGALGDPYTRGALYSGGSEVAGVDQAFRSYYDDSFVAAPEPSSGLLLGAGLVLLAARRRTRA